MTIGELHELIIEAKTAEKVMKDHPFTLEMSEAVDIAHVLEQLRTFIESLEIC